MSGRGQGVSRKLMKPEPNQLVEPFRIDGPPGTNSGAFVIRYQSARLRVVASDGMGWDHVSVSLATRCPTWQEMCRIKGLFFKDEEVVMQIHPAKSDYINVHEYTLHLWRPQSKAEGEQMPNPIPLPPKVMV